MLIQKLIRIKYIDIIVNSKSLGVKMFDFSNELSTTRDGLVFLLVRLLLESFLRLIFIISFNWNHNMIISSSLKHNVWPSRIKVCC